MAIAIKLKQVIYAHALRASSRFTCSCRKGLLGHATTTGWRCEWGEGGCLNVRVVDNACLGLKLSTWNAIFQTVYFLCKFAYISATPPRTLLSSLPLSLSLSPSGDFLQGADSHAVRRLSEEKNGEKLVAQTCKRNVLHSLERSHHPIKTHFPFRCVRVSLSVCVCAAY